MFSIISTDSDFDNFEKFETFSKNAYDFAATERQNPDNIRVKIVDVSTNELLSAWVRHPSTRLWYQPKHEIH